MLNSYDTIWVHMGFKWAPMGSLFEAADLLFASGCHWGSPNPQPKLPSSLIINLILCAHYLFIDGHTLFYCVHLEKSCAKEMCVCLWVVKIWWYKERHLIENNNLMVRNGIEVKYYIIYYFYQYSKSSFFWLKLLFFLLTVLFVHLGVWPFVPLLLACIFLEPVVPPSGGEPDMPYTCSWGNEWILRSRGGE